MNPARPPSRQLPSALVAGLAALLLAAQWWLGVSATRDLGVTTDELVHVAGGFSYWKFDDYRLQPENGNLPQRLAALPWVAAGARLEHSDPKVWGKSNVWRAGHELFYESGNNTDYLLLLSRGVMALMGTALGLAIFLWSRRLWGDAGALFSLGLYAFCPNFLAHAPLATSDVTSALALLLACGAFWRVTHRLDWKTLGLSAGATALAVVAKFSFPLLAPIFAVLAVVRMMASSAPLELHLRPLAARPLTRGAEKLVALAAVAVGQAAVALVVIWACFGFRFSAVGPGMPAQTDFFWAWSMILPGSGAWQPFLQALRTGHILPEAFVNGFATVLYAAAERSAFLNGEYSSTGWFHFFPYAFLVKTPLTQLAAYLLAAAAGLEAWRRGRRGATGVPRTLYALVPLLTLFAIYWAVSLRSHLNIGHRHILPIYPVLFIIAGGLLRMRKPRWLILVAVALVAGEAAESTVVRPNYLAYFNSFAGGPENGWRHLVDSSLDWGQNLPGVARWLEREARPGENVYVSYYGSGDYRYEGIRARELGFIYNFDRPQRWFEPGPGIYCFSASMLQNVYSDWRGPWTPQKERTLLTLRRVLAETPKEALPRQPTLGGDALYALDQLRCVRLCTYLRLRRPDAVIGYSFFIYRLDAEEVRAAVYGTPSELADAMDRAQHAAAPGR
jgi:hypothetical protein